VYRALHDLSEARLIEPLDKSADLAQEGPNRRRFTTTSEGERRYEQWLQSAPQSSVEFFRRIATARPEDLPVLLDLVIREEHGLLAQHRELRVPEVDKLVSRPAPWGEIIAAFLGSAKLNEVSSQLTFLYSLRRALEELLDKTTDQAPAS
jgi:DNA-binding PadR family transcriptional regulator